MLIKMHTELFYGYISAVPFQISIVCRIKEGKDQIIDKIVYHGFTSKMSSKKDIFIGYIHIKPAEFIIYY